LIFWIRRDSKTKKREETYEYLLKNKKYKEIYYRVESRYFGTFSFENLGINKNQKEYYEKYSYMLNNTLGSDVLFEHANGQKLVLKSNARFDIISLLTNFDRIHSQVIIVKDNVSTVHVEHVKTMSGFDRECSGNVALLLLARRNMVQLLKGLRAVL